MQERGKSAIPVLRYCFRIINWHQKEIRNLERKTMKMPTFRGQHHPRVDTDTLYFPEKREDDG
jgi:hypothetical protein